MGPRPTFSRGRAGNGPMCSGDFSLCPLPTLQASAEDDYKTGRHLCIMVIKGHETGMRVKLVEEKYVTSVLPDSVSVVISPKGSYHSLIAASKILPLL